MTTAILAVHAFLSHKPNEQTQDIAELNRDTSNTSDTIAALPDFFACLAKKLECAA